MNLLSVLSNQMVTALTNARLYVDSLERVRLQEEVSMARQIQLDLLPAEPPRHAHMAISAHSTPSRTVGGDFYDFIETREGRIGMVIADASGKGMPAALMIAQIQAIMHSEINNGNPVANILTSMNSQMFRSSSSEKYVTLFYGELDAATGDFHYSNAGHNYPALLRSDGTLELLQTGGAIIGALPDMSYESTRISLKPNDVLFFFTDGLSEAMNEKEEEFTEQRIYDLICEHRKKDPQAIIDSVLEEVRKFDPTYPPRDDTTIVALKMNDFIGTNGQ
jgi:sigma-B regulation protein RsbU (phosphoserine phosphatase)